MNIPQTGNNDNHNIMAMAALFESRFSIDWIQDLSKAKASLILQTLEDQTHEKILQKHEPGIFSFRELSTREKLKKSIPSKDRQNFHRSIARLMILEASDNEQAVFAAAAQLMHVNNDLEGCQILLEAGNRFRQKGESAQALKYYDKAIADLDDKTTRPEEILYVKTVIGYSKDRLSISTPEIAFSLFNLLKKALVKAKKYNDKVLQSILLLHLAAVQYERIQYGSAQTYYFKGRKIALTLNDPTVERTLDSCSMVHYCYSGLFSDAVKMYETIEPTILKNPPEVQVSLKMGIVLGLSYTYTGQVSQSLGKLNQIRDNAVAQKDHDAMVRASVYIGFALIMKNDFQNALLQIQEAFKHPHQMDPVTRGFGNLLLARIYLKKKDVNTSFKYLKLALKDRHRYSYTSRGQMFEFCLAIRQGKFPEVKELDLEKEVETTIEIGNIYNQGVAYRYRALLYQEQNASSEKILKTLKTSLSLLEQSGGKLEIARTKEAIARFHLNQHDIPNAKLSAREAALILNEIGNRNISSDLEHLLDARPVKESLVEEILDFAPDLVQIQDIKQVAQKIISTIIKITQAERGAIFLYDARKKDTVDLLTAKNISDDDMKKNGFIASQKMILKSARTGHEILDTDFDENNGLFSDDDIKSRICIPLLLRESCIGVLYLDNRLFKSTFKQQDLKILSYFAAFAAIALDNAHSYEQIKILNQRLNEEKTYLEEQQLEHLHFDDFIAASPEIKKVLTLIERVAPMETTVLIMGETGVGKEMVARAIHQQSDRRECPFIRVNCSAFPESLIASELFGHEKGSFTGADKTRIGRFELADNGTLFLDEIGDISMDIQIRLLRVLQTRKFERVGASQSIESNFRLLTATNRNLEKAVQDGRFRQDLYYRLNVFPIHVPPLRDRTQDISPLALYFLNKYSAKMNKSFKSISERQMNKLLMYKWPGNVRELENVIERGVILNTGSRFRVPDLTGESQQTVTREKLTLKELEKRHILETLQKTNWKIYGDNGAAQLLGINHSTLYSRMKKLGIQPGKK